MKRKSIALLLIVSVLSCSTETIRFDSLAIITPNKESIKADGFDSAVFRIQFDDDSDIALIKAKAQIVNGKFADSETNELTIQPIKDPNGIIRADVIVTSTTIVDSLKVTFNINEYKTNAALNSIRSVPSSINLQASAFSVANSFESEISITGSIQNEEGRKASNGYQIVIYDTFNDGTAVNGLIRNASLVSNNGQISFIYSPGPVEADQFLTIAATVLDENGIPIGVTNQIQVYITNND